MRRAQHAARTRDAVYRWVTLVLARLFVPAARLAGGKGRARHVAGQWALAVRFPAEKLAGLTPATRVAFENARTVALWEHGELLGLTSGHREVEHQQRLYHETIRDLGSLELARRRVLPPEESRHVAGTALDVRPAEGARWLERHGGAYGLYRIYDNEWWHFEYRPEGRPRRLPHAAGEHIDGFEMISAWTR